MLEDVEIYTIQQVVQFFKVGSGFTLFYSVIIGSFRFRGIVLNS